MSDTQVLVVAVLESGRVIHRFARLPRALSPAAVTRLSNGLDEMRRGVSLASVPARIAVPAELAGQEDDLQALARIVTRGAAELDDAAYLEGTSHIFEQPEFRDPDRVEPLVRLLEERRSVYEH